MNQGESSSALLAVGMMSSIYSVCMMRSEDTGERWEREKETEVTVFITANNSNSFSNM